MQAGFLIGLLQEGESLSLPASRPMPSIGPRCHELRISDRPMRKIWRIIYRFDPDAIVIVETFEKKTQATPKRRIDTAQQRLKEYDGKED